MPREDLLHLLYKAFQASCLCPGPGHGRLSGHVSLAAGAGARRHRAAQEPRPAHGFWFRRRCRAGVTARPLPAGTRCCSTRSAHGGAAERPRPGSCSVTPGRGGRTPPPPCAPLPARAPPSTARPPLPQQPRRRGQGPTPAPHGPRTAYSPPRSLPPSRPPPSLPLAPQPEQVLRVSQPDPPRPGRPSPSSFPRQRRGLRGSETGPLRQRPLWTGSGQAALAAPRVIDGAHSR